MSLCRTHFASVCVLLAACFSDTRVGGQELTTVIDELQEKLLRIPAAPDGRQPTSIEFPAQEARFVRLVIHRTSAGAQPCIDELEVYGPDAPQNLALAERGAVASASSVISGYPIHAIAHLNADHRTHAHATAREGLSAHRAAGASLRAGQAAGGRGARDRYIFEHVGENQLWPPEGGSRAGCRGGVP